MKTLHVQRREGITPVIATVILIAVTLIAAVAVTGFTFGLFGSFTASPQVTVTGSSLSAGGLANGAGGTSLTATCATSAGAGSYVALTNTGTSTATVTSGTIVYGGSTIPLVSFTNCPTAGFGATPGTTVYVQLSASPELSPTATVGEQYIVNVVLSTGVTIPASGTFLV